MNNLQPIEPEIVAVVALADALESVRVGPRRRASAPRVGLAPVSDVYLPTDEGYAAQGGSPLLRAVHAGTLAGLYDGDAPGPSAWVVPVDAARLEGEGQGDGGRPGDDPFALEVMVLVRALDAGATRAADRSFPLVEGSLLLLRHRLRDLWRRLRVDGTAIAVPGGQWTLSEWAQAWSGDYRESYFTARCLLSHEGEQIAEPDP